MVKLRDERAAVIGTVVVRQNLLKKRPSAFPVWVFRVGLHGPGLEFYV